MDRTIFSGILLGILSLQIGLVAAPMISADSTDVDVGTVYDGQKKVVNYTFKIKNTGDSPLTIKQVKASCGCTAVGYDSIIQPGKIGKVSEEIALDKIYTGSFRKYITVFSNAKNDSILRLSLGGVLRSHVEVSPTFIQMSAVSGQNKSQAELQITSTKKDLKITEVSFKSYDEAQSGPSWQSALSSLLDYQLIGPENKGTDNDYSYRLKIFTKTTSGGNQQGRFIIKTNHPQKSEIPVEGILQQ